MPKHTTESRGMRPSSSGYGTLVASDDGKDASMSITPSSSSPSLAESSQTLQATLHNGKGTSENEDRSRMGRTYTDLGSVSMGMLMIWYVSHFFFFFCKTSSFMFLIPVHSMCVLSTLPSIDGSILFIIQSTVASQFKRFVARAQTLDERYSFSTQAHI